MSKFQDARTTWGYARLSVDLGQIGLETQAAEVQRFAMGKGWDIPPERMISETVPAYRRGKTPVRQGFLRLIEEAERDPERFRLVTYNLDRLVRDLGDWLRLRAVADRGAEIHATTGNLDLSTGVGRMQAGVVTSVKEFEIEELTRRIRAQKTYRKAQGEFLGVGMRSFGYTDRTGARQVLPDEAALIKQAVQDASSGKRWQAIADDWNAQGVTTPNGAKWTAHNVSKTLESPVLYGEIVYREPEGERVVKAPWEPILTDHDRIIVKELKQQRRTYKGSQVLKHPLSGLLVCGKCETSRRMASNGPRKYLCTECYNAIHKVYTEQLLEKMCLLRLRDWQPNQEQPLQQLDLDAEHAELRDLDDLRRQGRISAAMFQLGAREIQERMESKRRQHQSRVKTIPSWMQDGDTILRTWDSLDAKKRRAVMQAVFQEVRILPFDPSQGQGRFQPERIQIRYR